MAISMDALLKIKANVQGEGAVQGLAKNLGSLQDKAGRVQGGLKGLASSAGGLGGALQSLLPLATGAGLVTMAKGAIDTADNLAKMSAKTGVSVEQLSKFKQAADLGGTSIEGVSSAMLKLNKGLAGGTGPAADALSQLGISANDASGKLKSTDQVMLEVADKFQAMPDGAEKSALAMQLFGKSGAEMIPMLNGGRKGIEGLSATMSTDFAKKAEVFNDKITTIQSKLMELAVNLGSALMPAFTALTDGVGVLVDGFSKLPGPVQTLIGLGAGLLIAWGPITGTFSLVATILTTIGPLIAGLGPLIAGWAGAIGPAMGVITAAFSGLLAWLTGTLVPGLLAIFSGPVGWTVLAVAAVVAMCVYFREPIGKFLSWLGGVMQQALKGLMDLAYQLWVQPWVNLWNNVLRAPITAMGTWLQGVWQGISKAFNDYVSTPITKAWNTLTELLPKAMERVANVVKGVWTGLVDGVKGVIRGLLQMVANAINSVGAQVNRLISAFNSLPGPDIPLVPSLSVPAFAAGGVVGRPTLAMVGEGGEREYIVPESKMAAASSRFLAGARGADVIPSSSGSVGGGSPVINITTGPVVEFDGKRYVSVDDLERAMRVTAEGVIGRLRTPAARIALGMV